jgi:hypothetical protein
MFFFIYSLILIKVNRAGKEIEQQFCSSSHISEYLREREIQITRTTMLASVSFFVLFAPSVGLMVLDPMPPNSNYPLLHVISYIISWSSGCIHPIIYVLSNKLYWRALKKTFGKKVDKYVFPMLRLKKYTANTPGVYARVTKFKACIEANMVCTMYFSSILSREPGPRAGIPIWNVGPRFVGPDLGTPIWGS